MKKHKKRITEGGKGDGEDKAQTGQYPEIPIRLGLWVSACADLMILLGKGNWQRSLVAGQDCGPGEPLKREMAAVQCSVHHLANLGQASPALGVGCRTVAVARLLGGEDLCHDQRPIVFLGILADIIFRVAEAVAD